MRKISKWRRDVLYSSKWVSEVLMHNHLVLYLWSMRGNTSWEMDIVVGNYLYHDSQQAEGDKELSTERFSLQRHPSIE